MFTIMRFISNISVFMILKQMYVLPKNYGNQMKA